jgi:acyl-coenzyme A synthetase/AMP-(fatty) acid ligase
MAWRYGKPVHMLTDLDWGSRSALFRSARGGFGGAPLQLLDFAQRLKDGAPAVLVTSGDFFTAPLGEAVARRFPDAKIHKLYGLTEVAGRFCILPHDARVRAPDAAGWPMPGFSVSLRDVDAESGLGELVVSSPLLFHGYWRAEEGFVPRGTGPFPTGDHGRIGDDGMVTLVGRANDSFKVGGEKVDRASIEAAIAPLLAAAEFCVLPVPHATYGLIPALFVAAEARAQLPARSALAAAVRERLPSRFVPALMLYAGHRLPRLDNGKVDRQMLTRSASDMDSLE